MPFEVVDNPQSAPDHAPEPLQSIAWCYCTQGIEIVPVAGGLCLEFTNGSHLFVRC